MRGSPAISTPGRREGAKIVTGGKKAGRSGYFVQPTVLIDTTPTCRWCARKSSVRWCALSPSSDDDIDRIATQANDTIYGLAASVWTRDSGMAHRMARRIRSGTVWINCHNVFDSALPVGGYKQSGWGREMGEEVFHNYTEIKAITAAL